MRRNAFSLIEVLFAVAFLMMVGVGMTALNAAASRLIATAEVKTVALALSEQAAAFMALAKKTQPESFDNRFEDCFDETGCYLTCPEDVSESCVVSEERRPFQMGRSKLQFALALQVKDLTGPISDDQLLIVTTSWGQGTSRQLRTVHVLEP